MVYNGINYAINEYKNFDTFKTIVTYFLLGLNLRFSVHVVRSLWPHHNGIKMRIEEIKKIQLICHHHHHLKHSVLNHPTNPCK